MMICQVRQKRNAGDPLLRPILTSLPVCACVREHMNDRCSLQSSSLGLTSNIGTISIYRTPVLKPPSRFHPTSPLAPQRPPAFITMATAQPVFYVVMATGVEAQAIFNKTRLQHFAEYMKRKGPEEESTLDSTFVTPTALGRDTREEGRERRVERGGPRHERGRSREEGRERRAERGEPSEEGREKTVSNQGNNETPKCGSALTSIGAFENLDTRADLKINEQARRATELQNEKLFRSENSSPTVFHRSKVGTPGTGLPISPSLTRNVLRRAHADSQTRGNEDKACILRKTSFQRVLYILSCKSCSQQTASLPLYRQLRVENDAALKPDERAKLPVGLGIQIISIKSHVNLLLNQTEMLCLHLSTDLPCETPCCCLCSFLLSGLCGPDFHGPPPLRPMFPLVSRGVIHGSRNDRTAESFHFLVD
ncbi:hypothetical protein EYF80_009064 [Liparis tanakae]|uniref:Uncharacterized protein n=1 Tax=Liparis tanakae TaxID=230148 RepID=A0A4Z2IU30_9TELE|nr:hypothetical protein EYF80_009064 [Liparis tanakae]